MSEYGPQIAALARRAEREYDALSRGDDPSEPAFASQYLRDGVGQAIAVYIDARTGGQPAPLSPAELDALEYAMHRWLECYARCHGVVLESDVSIRTAAEVVLETRTIDDVGQLVTGVPSRCGGEREREREREQERERERKCE
ncbi:hypothetical protein C483_02376 [Natrialba hulunbeirensis JCM 10989]|uniref:DUF8055 domain-containing protein n=1 Tax=Natrialba hulunbeirensis JCM 10989 TaxID=1227493 RepID=M0ACU6_9EURY|nr:hypothetical protein [Natrialba hulunbeirensis]ELY95173.1 hypothetical protein C483_02376 [Natrialba hulunbeirensis JCM 10989]